MAKKMIFLLILLLGLMLASVSAYATTDTDTTTPDTGLTEEEVPSSVNSATVSTKDAVTATVTNQATGSVSNGTPSQASTQQTTNIEEESGIDYEQCADPYLDLETESTESLFVNINWNQKDPVNNPLYYVMTGAVKQSDSNSPLIIMLYVKSDGAYIPLLCKDDTNMIETSGVAFVSRTNLLYLGSDKANDVRIIAFKKEDADNLVPGENLQISDKRITARKTVIIPVPLVVDSVLEAIKLQ